MTYRHSGVLRKCVSVNSSFLILVKEGRCNGRDTCRHKGFWFYFYDLTRV